MSLQEAIELVKANGYTVRKKSISRKKALETVGPTFVANWNDGVVTRMSIHTRDENPDLGRAVRVSRAAYESRTKGRGIAKVIVDGYFTRDGELIHKYDEIFVDDFGGYNEL